MPPFFGGTMSEVLEKEKTGDGRNHVCIMQMVSNADQDADFFWEQLFDSCDDENDLADTVDMLTRLYMQRKMKALYWTFAIMKGQGMNLPLYILTGTAFANPEVTLFYFGSFFLRIAWRMLQSMEELGMEDFLYDRLMA